MKFCVLASGSKGNAIWVEEGDLAVLFDCGLSFKELKRRVALVGLDIGKLACVLVSHEHRDHVSGLGPLCRALKIPALANRATMEAASFITGSLVWDFFKTSDSLTLGSFKITPLPISHDSRDPVAFLIESPSGRLGLATDMGVPTNLIRQKFRGLSSLILEFNHDFKMLMEGSYPWPLKQRIRSRTGHLANEVAAELVGELKHADLKHLVLAHLSECNNSPGLALEAARLVVGDLLEPEAAGQKEPGSIFCI